MAVEKRPAKATKFKRTKQAMTYPWMWQALSAKSQGGLPLPGLWQTLQKFLDVQLEEVGDV